MRWWFATPLVLGIGSCVEYNPQGNPDSPDSLESDSESTLESEVEAAEEACNGLDEDLDGIVDEGFEDEDADSVADCLQCGLVSKEGGALDATPECDAFVRSDSAWDAEVLWEFMPDDRQGCLTAAGDVDGDGDVEVVARCTETTYLLDGATGALEWQTDLFVYTSPLALADLDGDGRLEIIGVSPDSKVAVLDADGLLFYLGSAEIGDAFSASFTVVSHTAADLEGDGELEIISHRGIIDGSDGSTIDAWDADPFFFAPIAVGDVDSDGYLEVATLGRLMAYDGTVIWDHSDVVVGTSGMTPTPVFVDLGASTGVLWMAPEVMLLVDADGAMLAEVERTPDRRGNLACAGDLDGDGQIEVVAGGLNSLEAREIDGTLLWEIEVVDETTSVSCTTFDFDADGAREIVVPNQNAFTIRDGATGNVVFEDTDWFTYSVNDLPMIVDLDGDGSAEIVLSSASWDPGNAHSGYNAGVPLRVYSHPEAGWPDPGRLWASDSWGGCLLNTDGTPRSTPCRPWADHLVWRGQPQGEGATALWGADVSVELIDSCIAESEYDGADARFSFRVVNRGPEDVNQPLTVVISLLDASGAATYHSSVEVPAPLAPGFASASMEVVLQRVDVTHGVRVAVGTGDGATVPDSDCQERNNSLTITFEDR